MYTRFKIGLWASHSSMNRFIPDQRGVSVIVGALLLTLIVVTAAASFSLFVNQQQEERQEAEAQEQRRELEEIDVVSIQPTYVNKTLVNLSFTIGNRHLKASDIMGLRINNHMWYKDIIVRNETGGNVTYDTVAYENLSLASYEDITFTLRYLNDSNATSRVQGYQDISVNTPITIRVLTGLSNSFEQTFYPPTATIRISTEEIPTGPYGSAYKTMYVLDGSRSDHPGDGYIVTWKWNVTKTSASPLEYNETTGRITQPPDPFFIASDNTYDIELTVTDNYGMMGMHRITLDLS